jgi:hypothetical protein
MLLQRDGCPSYPATTPRRGARSGAQTAVVRVVIGLVVVYSMLATTAGNAQVIFSSSFDEDDTSFFEFSGPPSGQLTFDSTLGYPDPGSLRLARSETASSLFARTDCLPFDPARRYSFHAHTRRETSGGQCGLSYEIFTTTDCSGDIFIGNNAAGSTMTGVWELLETFAGTTYLGQEEFQSIRFRMTLGPPSTAACNFDNVYIASEQVEDIPTLSRTGQLLLLLALPLLGLYLLRSTL